MLQHSPKRLTVTLAVAVIGFSHFALAAAAATAMPDTTHCGPQVVVLDARSKSPIALANVYLRAQGDWASAYNHDRSEMTDDRGRVDFAALPLGEYEVAIVGTSRKRPLPKWQPPPGEPEVAVGFDPWRRPNQVQRFKLNRTWRVTQGNCLDTLVVLVPPTRWQVETGERATRITIRRTAVGH